MRRSELWLIPVLAVLALDASADVSGSRDHPSVGRFKGSSIIGYAHRNYDEFALPVGASRLAVRSGSNEYVPPPSKALEGQVTRILYDAGVEASVLEVFRNYEKALAKAGFETLYQCKAEACGWNFIDAPAFKPALREYAFSDLEEGQRFLSAKKTDPEKGDTYVSLWVGKHGTIVFKNRTLAEVDVIEVEPLDTDQIVVKAEKMSEEIGKSGHVSLYGIYFDTDSARLKPSSDPALEEIGKLLKQDPSLKLYVVGHTDNTGTLAHNQTLSEQRARAVVEALVGRYAAQPSALDGRGVGPLAPVASNETEEGRAKNRRVELVRQ